jgi:hypothetical protein
LTSNVVSFVASRVSPRRPPHFSLLRQRKVSKEKASLSQVRCAVPCAARSGQVWRKLGFVSNMRQPDPPAAALLSPVSMALHPEDQLRSLAFGVANSRISPSPRLDDPSASAATRDTTQPACKVSASERTRGTRPQAPPPHAMRPCRAAQHGADQGWRCLSAASLARPRPTRAAQGTPKGHGLGSPFFWVLFFGEAKKSTSPAGARPG